jgi:hypothetical protein
MLTLEAFLDLFLKEESASTPSHEEKPRVATAFAGKGFQRQQRPHQIAAAPTQPLGRLLMASLGLPAPQEVDASRIILSGNPASKFLPQRAYFWKKTSATHHYTLLFELEYKGLEILQDHLFQPQRAEGRLEDALHRMIQYFQEGFAKKGDKRTAEIEQGSPEETLILVSIRDDREDTEKPTQLVCFGTKSNKTAGLETFQISDAPRQWASENKPLAEEHLTRLYHRHITKLNTSAWQDAFITGEERDAAEKLLSTCSQSPLCAKEIQDKTIDLFKYIAKNFGRRGQQPKLRFEELPNDHLIGADPQHVKKKDFINHLAGLSILDANDRLLGYIVYCLDNEREALQLNKLLSEHNAFHNVLVIHPQDDQTHFKLWQGRKPLEGKLTKQGAQFVGAGEVIQLISRFFVVSKSKVKSPKQLAEELAYRARYIRQIVLVEITREKNAPKKEKKPVLDLYQLFDQALARQSEEEFADAYAQTIAYGLLSARWIARYATKTFSFSNVASLLPSTSPFLSSLFERLLHIPISSGLRWLIEDLISLLHRTAISEVFEDEERDPVIHFYEDFLDAYDASIRAARGVYYTPDEVVQYIVKTTHQLLIDDFGLPLGLADTTSWEDFAKQQGIEIPKGIDPKMPFVQILDPATGTGTFLKYTIEIIHDTMMQKWAGSAWKEDAQNALQRNQPQWQDYVHTSLLPRLYGFELMMAPYIVCHLRLGLLLEETGFLFQKNTDRLQIFLTNTLEKPIPMLEEMEKSLAQESRLADKIKHETPISILIGNPPYEREPNDPDKPHKGGWVRGNSSEKRPLLDDYIEPVREIGKGGLLRNIYNLYVYFWRWATWKVFEKGSQKGIIGLITPSSFLRGDGFAGIRKHFRELANKLWIVDLEGDQRGSRTTENIFLIKTPVCITIIERCNTTTPTYLYQRILGTREEKLHHIQQMKKDSEWKSLPSEKINPFIDTTDSPFSQSPYLTNLFPWQSAGSKINRTWPIGENEITLKKRWAVFIASEEKKTLFKETRDRQVALSYKSAEHQTGDATPLADLPANHPPPVIANYGFRSFDKQKLLFDARLSDFIRYNLWYAYSPKQVYLTSLLSDVIGKGAAVTLSAYVPDLHYFCGRGGKDVIPLWRDPEATEPNVCKGVWDALNKAYARQVAPEDIFSYAYAVLANPGYVERFEEELQVPGPRLPLTKDAALFAEGALWGRKLIRLHTYGERFREKGDDFVLSGRAHLKTAIPLTAEDYPEKFSYDEKTEILTVGKGKIAGVGAEVFGFSVSGLEVVRSWLKYRMKKGAGKKSSPLDDIRPENWTEEMTRELLELLWVLEQSLAMYPALDAWFERVLEGDLFTERELPKPTESEQKEPKIERKAQGKLL